MSNELKWTDWGSAGVRAPTMSGGGTPTGRSPWPPFLGCLAGLVVLTTAVPGPTSWASASFGDQPAASFGGAAQEALLLTAGVIVWTLLAWGVAVGCIAALGHLPGTTGRVSRAVLDRVAPAAAGRLVAATLGVSLLAGTTACAAPVMAGSDPTTAAAAASSAAASSTDPAASVEASDGPSIDIDWPLTTAAEPAQTPAAPPPASSTATGPPDTTTSPPATPTDWPDSAPTGAVAPTPAVTPDQAGTDQPSDPAPTAPVSQTPPSTSEGQADSAAGDADLPGDTDPPGETDPPGADEPHAKAPAAVIVLPGDTLWSIAAATLPASSTTSEIDSAWRAWYLTNERVIGNDPDVIRPGQSLLPPTTDAEPSP
jgi:hypothetical protein